MGDELVSALLQDVDLRVLVATSSGLSQHVRGLLTLSPASAALLSQGLTAAALMGALQKGESRINLQLECDGQLRGMFADANGEGHVRGYVKNSLAEAVGQPGPFQWRAALGNSGFLSVLRDLGGGEYYRSAVQLEHFDFARDLQNYFGISDQLKTHVRLVQPGKGGDPLGLVGGVLVQPLPDGDAAEFARLGEMLTPERVGEALVEADGSAIAFLKTLFPRADLEVMSRFPLAFVCGCSKERVLRALVAMGRAELEDVLAKEGQAEATCHFCTTRYVIPGDEIRTLIQEASG